MDNSVYNSVHNLCINTKNFLKKEKETKRKNYMLFILLL